MNSLIPAERIERRIYLIRKHKVMLDRDLAGLYGVSTKVLNQAVKRNMNRFPPEFMFRLSKEERDEVVTISDHLKNLKYSYQMPLAFTEHGVAMLSSILNSPRAIQVNIQIIKTFIRIRGMTASHENLRQIIDTLDKKYDARFRIVFAAIRKLMRPDKDAITKIGFRPVGD
ncbi:MAG: ORF6N domain-containing protein [Elusimicrobiota bacterium]